MAISFNTGATASANTAASVAITIPSGVLTGDVMLMFLTVFCEVGSAPSIAFSGAGGTWTLATVTTGTNPENGNNGTLYAYGYAYYRVATAGDPGASLTITETGSPAGTTWLAVALASYTGANTSSPVDVAGGANASAALVTCPSETTATANDWAVYMGGGGVNGSGGTVPGPTGATQRENLASSAGIGAAIFDSNGSAGGSGTSIGGTASFQFQTTNHPNTGQLNAFTIGLKPAAAAVAAVYGALRQAVRARPPLGGSVRAGEAAAELAPGTGNISGPVAGAGHGGGTGASGALVRNPVQGPLFRQAVQAVQAKLPQQPLLRGRCMSNPGTPVRNPSPGPVFRQKPAPVRFILPPWQPRAGRIGSSFGAPVINPLRGPPVYALLGHARARLPQLQPRAGRVTSNPGAPVRNPAAGPVFAQKTWPVQAQDPLPKRGRVYVTAKFPLAIVPPPAGPPFSPAVQAVRARLPLQPLLRGRASSNAGAPVRNPSAGPVFRQADQPVRARTPLPARGRTASSSGGPVRNPVPSGTGPVFVQRTFIRAQLPLSRRGTCRAIRFGPLPANPSQGPVFTPAVTPARARTPLPPRGRTASNPGGPVQNPVPGVTGPPFFPFRSPVRVHPVLPPRGRIASSPGTPVRNPSPGPVFRQATEPARARVPQVFSKGRTSANPGNPPVISAPLYPQHGPVRIRPVLPPRGRTSGNPGIPVAAAPKPAPVYPPHGPVQARRPLPPHGRVITGNPGAPRRNPSQGPRFTQAVQPCRSRVPPNAPRGRTASGPGGPVQNKPFNRILIATGDPFTLWATSGPVTAWDTGDPLAAWETGSPFTIE